MKASEAKSKTDLIIDGAIKPILKDIERAAQAGQYSIRVEYGMMNIHLEFRLKELGYTVTFRSAILGTDISWEKPTDEHREQPKGKRSNEMLPFPPSGYSGTGGR